jgi:hypothetical protein
VDLPTLDAPAIAANPDLKSEGYGSAVLSNGCPIKRPFASDISISQKTVLSAQRAIANA